jgi:hypothetical protein
MRKKNDGSNRNKVITPPLVPVSTFVPAESAEVQKSWMGARKRFTGCNANLCPVDPNLDRRTWFIGEDVCKNPECAGSAMIRRQKQLNRLKPSTYLDNVLTPAWLIKTAPTKRVLTPEQKLQLQERAKKAREAQKERREALEGSVDKAFTINPGESDVTVTLDEQPQKSCLCEAKSIHTPVLSDGVEVAVAIAREDDLESVLDCTSVIEGGAIKKTGYKKPTSTKQRKQRGATRKQAKSSRISVVGSKGEKN